MSYERAESVRAEGVMLSFSRLLQLAFKLLVSYFHPEDDMPYELRIMRNVLNTGCFNARNVQYTFSWSTTVYTWRTPVTFQVRGIVHLWESIYQGNTCKIYPVDNWKQCCMDELLVNVQKAFISLHPREESAQKVAEVQTDLSSCTDLLEQAFCALLDDGQAEAIINPLFYSKLVFFH